MTRILDELAHARTRDRILDAARSLFADEGFHAASMNELAKSCRLTKAGLYHYFPSKQAILGALHNQLVEEAEAQLDTMPRFKDLGEALAQVGQRYLAHFRDPKHRQMMLLSFKLGLHEEGRSDPSFAVEGRSLDEKLLTIFLPYLPAGTSPEKGRLFALQFFGSLFYQVFVLDQFCGVGPKAVDAKDYLQQLVQTFAANPQAALKGAS